MQSWSGSTVRLHDDGAHPAVTQVLGDLGCRRRGL